MRPALVALLLVVAVLVWPVRDRIARAAAVLASGHDSPDAWPDRGHEGADSRGGTGSGAALRDLWHQDPLEVFRRWRMRQKPDDVVAAALALLDATEPGLVAGLPPATALSLAVDAVNAVEIRGQGAEAEDRTSRGTEARGSESRSDAHTRASGPSPVAPLTSSRSVRVGDGAPGTRTTASRLGADLAESARQGNSVAAVWADYADRTGSKDLAFVAAAWRLSEDTGVPLAVAVARAAAGLREARTRQRKVAVAVAGPKATVVVLTVLPLTGPFFGLACGVGPGELYGGRPVAAVSAAGGVLLMVVGRLWCRRMIRRAVAS